MFRSFCFCVSFFFISTSISVQGKCMLGLQNSVPTSIYHDLRCTPINDPTVDEHCLVKYDCSHIYSRPEKTCHFQGKTYKVGEFIDNQDLTGISEKDCSCTENLEFSCPEMIDGCAEDWLEGIRKFGCYLKYSLNGDCADGEICPPFDGNAVCDVKQPDGRAYREGQKFTHPQKDCVQCICNKGFDGTLEAPFCQPVNCTAELEHSKDIDKHCGPYYDYKEDSCCPKTWVCPSETGKFTASPIGTPSNRPASEYFCKFGERTSTLEITTIVINKYFK